MYPLVDTFYYREKSYKYKTILVCKKSNNRFYEESLKDVKRYRCKSRIFDKCPAYFTTDTNSVFILKAKLYHTCFDGYLIKKEQEADR